MADEYGGIEVDEPQTDQFGGIAVVEEAPKATRKGTFLPETSKEGDARIMGMGEPLITLPRVEGSNPLLQAFMSGVTGQPPSRPTADTAAAAINVAKTLPEFITSPLGIATAPVAAAGGIPARLLGLGFAGQMAAQVPESAREAGRLSVEGTPQEAKEALLGLGSNIVLPAALAGGALGRPLKAPPGMPRTEPPPETGVGAQPVKTGPLAPTAEPSPVSLRYDEEAKRLDGLYESLNERRKQATSPEEWTTITRKIDDVIAERVKLSSERESPAPPSVAAESSPTAITPLPSTEAQVPSLEEIQKGTPKIPEASKGQTQNQPIRIQLADGKVVPGLWNGYWEAPGTPFDKAPSVATVVEDKWSHGMLPKGAKILDAVPGFEQWKEKAASKEQPAETPPTAPQPPGGAAVLGEIQHQPMGEAAPTHGIAQRVREEQAGTGALGPEAATPGQGISAPDSVERGRQLLSQGLSPEQAVFEFNKTKAITADSMAVVRAHAEKLWRTAVEADRKAPNSPEAESAWEAYNKFTTDIKPMQTEWHRIGMAQQGEVNLDDGSFVSMRQKFNEETGRDLDPKQKDKAHRLATDNEQAEVATDKAQKTVKDEINKELKQSDDYTPEELALLEKYRQKGEDWPDEIQRLRKLWQALKPGTEKDLAKINYERELNAFESVTKLLRDKATRDANIENRKRIEQAQRDLDVAGIEEKRNQAALDAANERVKSVATERAKLEREASSKEAQQKLDVAKIAEKREQAARDAIAKTLRDAAARRAAAERKLQANPDQRVWSKVRDYMGQGVDDFNDLVAKVATDLGMKQAEVKRWIAFKPHIKQAVDNVWLKQQRERTLKETARRWLDDQSKAAWKRYASKIPGAAFGAKVFGHGFVAMGTHAPLVPTIPKYQAAFVRNAGKMYRMVVDPTYYESQVQELQRQPNFAVAKRAGLQNDPHGWEDYTNPVIKAIFGRVAEAGNRGYFALKLLRQDIFDVDWNKLPKTARIPQVATAIADATNHITGVTKAVAPRGLHVGLFAPRLLASRFALAFGDPARAADTFLNWKNADIGDKYFAVEQAKQKAWILGTFASLLALNQAVLSASGSKQKVNFTNPLEGDWMKFKAAGKNIAWGTPFLTLARMPARLWAIREGPKGRLRNVVYPEETTAKFMFEYGRSQASPFAQPLLDLWLKSDWQGRPLPSSTQPVPARLRKHGVKPYTWGEWASQSFTPIPFEEAQKEVWHAMGLGDNAQKAMSRASLLDSAIMGLTGSRIQDDWNVSRTTDTPSTR